MKAMVCTKYGPPELLQFQELEQPVPRSGELLVKIHAASLNYGDSILVRGQPFMARLMGCGLLKPNHTVLGTDIAGRVAAVAPDAARFQPGDALFADLGACGFGAFAEYVAAPEHAFTLKPAR